MPVRSTGKCSYNFAGLGWAGLAWPALARLLWAWQCSGVLDASSSAGLGLARLGKLCPGAARATASYRNIRQYHVTLLTHQTRLALCACALAYFVTYLFHFPFIFLSALWGRLFVAPS